MRAKEEDIATRITRNRFADNDRNIKRTLSAFTIFPRKDTTESLADLLDKTSFGWFIKLTAIFKSMIDFKNSSFRIIT